MATYLTPRQEQSLARRLRHLPHPVRLSVGGACTHPLTTDLLDWAASLAALAPPGWITVDKRPDDPGPCLTLAATGGRPFGITFWGTPSGHLLPLFLTAAEIDAGTSPAPDKTARDLFTAISRPVQVDLFVTPT